MIYEYTHEEKWKSLLQLWMSNIHMNALLDTFKISEIGDIKTKGYQGGCGTNVQSKMKLNFCKKKY